MVDRYKQKMGSGIVALASTQEGGQTSLVVGVTADLTERFDAVHFARLGAEILGGKGGGGRRDMAQSGGPEHAKVNELMARIEDEVKKVS
jgi:alanyl-tRNA synthetase